MATVAYPGAGGSFSVAPDGWNPYDSGADLLRSLRFNSDSAVAPITEVTILGYQGGAVQIFMSCAAAQLPALVLFFQSREIGVLSLVDTVKSNGSHVCKSTASIKFTDPKTLSSVFAAFCEHNIVPAAERTLAQSLCDAKDWRVVTPLSDAEEKALKAKRQNNAYFFPDRFTD